MTDAARFQTFEVLNRRIKQLAVTDGHGVIVTGVRRSAIRHQYHQQFRGLRAGHLCGKLSVQLQMKWLSLTVPAALGLLPLTVPAQRVTDNFDAGWSFLQADAAGAERVAFDDSTWRKLDLPHDWSIEGPFAATNLTGGAGGFLPSGVGWYRKHFKLPGGEPNRRIFVEFDGVMQNSDVWINGLHLSHRPYGYASFSDELTGQVNWGGDNVIAVRTDTSAQPASRWYSGAGIYRHVRLVQTAPVYIPPNEVFISTPEVSLGLATVHAQVTVTNLNSTTAPVFLNITLLAPDGAVAGIGQTRMQTIPPTGAVQFERDLVITHPQRWELNHPVRYQARVTVAGPAPETDTARVTKDQPQTAGTWYDETEVSFGVREFHFDADTGFWLNENNFKLKGVCLHQDGGALGVGVRHAVPMVQAGGVASRRHGPGHVHVLARPHQGSRRHPASVPSRH